MNGNFRREVGQRSHYIQTARRYDFNFLSGRVELKERTSVVATELRGPRTYSAYFLRLRLRPDDTERIR